MDHKPRKPTVSVRRRPQITEYGRIFDVESDVRSAEWMARSEKTDPDITTTDEGALGLAMG